MAVNYPSPALIESWQTGEFIEVLQPALAQVSDDACTRQRAAEVQSGIQAYFSADRPAVDVEVDYVALFEFNRERPPVHLLQHVHDHRGQTAPLELYRELTELYRSSGIALKRGLGATPPDHLSVQLECLAYLCGCLAHATTDESVITIRQRLQSFAQMLHWVEAPTERLAQHAPHPLYLPLLRLVRHVVDLCADN